jgi:hypothetical protein
MLEEIPIRWREAARVRIPKEACRWVYLGLPWILFNSMVKGLAAAQEGPESRPPGPRGSSMETTGTDQQFIANRSYVPTQEEIDALREDVLKVTFNIVYREGWYDGARYARQKARLSGMRKILLESMRHRFGSVSPQLRHRVSRISSTERLLELAGQVLTAETLEDLAL